MNTPPLAADTARPRPVPRTDAWVWASVAIAAASLAWTLVIFALALGSEPCTRNHDQCSLSVVAFYAWLIPQLFAAIPHLFAFIVLARYAERGNHGAPIAGLAVIALNVLLSIALVWYLSSLPSHCCR